MKFESPAALWGLASLALLILFSLWRQGAARVTVPSLVLWKKIPERNPPVRALRRPRWRLELLLQALAIAAVVAALAGPYQDTQAYPPRRIAIILDTSARLKAAGRFEKLRDEAAMLARDKLRGDQVSFYAASPSPRSFAQASEAKPVDVHVDLGPLIAAARASSEHVILFSDRPADGTRPSLRGAPADNVGIVEFSAGDDEVFVRLVNHGAPRPIPVEMVAGDVKVTDTVPAGATTWFRRGDYSKVASVRVSLGGGDSFPADDVVEAARLAETQTTVSVKGLLHPQLLKALRAISGVSVKTGEGAARVGVGVDDVPGPADVRVWLIPATGNQIEPVVARHPLTTDLGSRLSELKSFGELPAADRSGEPLLTVGGKVAAVVKAREIRLAVDLDAWQKTASFPIFWTNVIDFARKGAGLAVPRTGRPFALPAGSAVEKAPDGAVWELSPDGSLLAFTAGEYRLKTSEGARTVRVNLLDERESDTAGMTRALDWNPADPAGRVPRPRPWAWAAAGAALILLVLAWLLQRRSE